MIGFRAMAAGVAVAAGYVTFVSAETLTIATVNNDDMIIMQKLSSKWEQQTGNKINWVCSYLPKRPKHLRNEVGWTSPTI